MSHQLARRWFTTDEYNRMVEVGILTEDDRVELIDGEIIAISPIGTRHAACVNRLNMLLSRQVGQAFIVSVQNPITISDYSEPESDLAVLRWRVSGHCHCATAIRGHLALISCMPEVSLTGKMRLPA